MSALVLAAAVASDVLMTSVPTSLHPVAWMGKALGRLAGRPTGRPGVDLARGTLSLAIVAGAAGVAGAVAERYGRKRSVGRAPEVLLLASTFSIHGLLAAGARPLEALERGDLDEARDLLVSLVSRDRAALDESHIASAIIESLSENLADSVTAPLLAYAVAGLPGAMAYRAVNTADAMLGYRDEREWLGKPAARADDLLNLIPARLTAMALAATAMVVGSSPGAVLMASTAGASATDSPNSGWPMAAAAAGLGVWLEKPGSYRLGTGRTPGPSDARRARWWIAVTAYALAVAVAPAVLMRARR